MFGGERIVGEKERERGERKGERREERREEKVEERGEEKMIKGWYIGATSVM